MKRPPSKLPITGDYPPDWPQIADRVRSEVGHRCIRCGHPYEVGKHGKGEWSLCDEKCDHFGPLAYLSHDDTEGVKINPCARRDIHVQIQRRVSFYVAAQWRILTVHHLDGNKGNCAWWNLLALCQRCHLEIQGKVNPDLPYFLEHSAWFKPYAAGFYAKKYENRDITREEAMARLNELLAHEQLA